MADFLAIAMFALACIGLMGGYNVAFTLSGVSLIFAALLSLPGRIYPLITREILMAVPLFVFMGVMLEKSRIAEDLLESMGDLFGPLKGGLGISVVFVGALLAASTGIVGATVVTMGLLSLPTMLGDLFAGALLPGLILVALYAIYISITAYLKPAMAPAQDWPEGVSPWSFIRKTMMAMLPPIFLIVAVLGSILSGYATPTRGAALGALGAILLAAYRTAPTAIGRRAALFAAIGLMLLVVVDLTGVDMRFDEPLNLAPN